jgi:hypothetical protein
MTNRNGPNDVACAVTEFLKLACITTVLLKLFKLSNDPLIDCDKLSVILKYMVLLAITLRELNVKYSTPWSRGLEKPIFRHLCWS